MKFYALLFLFNSFLFSGSTANGGDEVLGVWLTDDGRAKIQVYKDKGRYFGKIVWLKAPNGKDGKPVRDVNNPKDEFKKRPVLGINLVKNFRFKNGKWEGGEIYDPDNGKTYSCHMKLKKGKLEVRGYIGVSLFGRTVVWTRTE